jgi:cysteine desulfurase family protein (TIGR01976 family)
MPIVLNAVRSHFPALKKNAIFFDNPGGTQVARTSVERIEDYLYKMNANHGGAFANSRASDASIIEARSAMADFLNAAGPQEIVFGANMTTLTFTISRALGRTLQPGDTIVLTHLDHDANVSPWRMLAEDRGLNIRFVDFHPENGTLDLEDMARALQEKPKLVAFGYASNALGTINPVAEITRIAHEAGALVYVDAVQYAPHGPIDVQKLGVDFLVCSAYKFFGPHLGILYGRYDLLESLTAYKVRPAPAHAPDKFETGTGNFEHMAGTLGALDYFEWLGQTFGEEYQELYAGEYNGRRLTYKMALSAVRAYEMDLNRELLHALQAVPGLKIYGVTDEAKLDQRVPTFSFTLEGFTPAEIAKKLDACNIYSWDGNFYALEVTTRLGLEGKGGLLRVGATHYNTVEEVHKLGKALQDIGR